ncbi:MAG TPA: acetylxylan esterase [Verrucomicrobiae bacterium]
MIRLNIRAGILFALTACCAFGAPLKDAEWQKYFEGEVARIETESFRGIESKADWERERPRLKRELRGMLGLDPMPERGDLRAQVTGKFAREGIVVEKLHFQSSPGLYVTGNLYRPEKVTARLPAILYLCGHGQVKSNGVSFGNKVAYQHHGAWFARNGYVCLTIDTIQLGEIEGLHHGTHREGMWWWNSRGYTPAGVEAWNSMRALDYLETRPEVDKTRMGVTGRSGGGAYSWWIAALDERVKVAAPVAGITDLHDHVVDGVVEGHCDCMYFVNTYRWDYPMVAALVAPRPLLICNSDKDTIFPLDGVVRTHGAAATVYGWLGAETNLGLLITEGPHKDTQDLQVPVFRWFNRHLKGEDRLIEMAATKLFTPEELRVFEKVPADEITSKIHETFVPSAKRNGEMTKDKLRGLLLEKTFAGWPNKPVPLRIERKQFSSEWDEVAFDSQENVRLKMYVKRSGGTPRDFELFVTSTETDAAGLKDIDGDAVLIVRGGADADSKNRAAVQTRRRYMLVGQTLDGMRIWDILRGVELLKSFSEKSARISVRGEGKQAANVLMAAVMSTEPIQVAGADIPSAKQSDTPDYLNFLKLTTWEELRSLVSKAESK